MKTIKLFAMAINRRLAIYVIVVAVFAVMHTLLLMAWVSSLEVGIPRIAYLRITDVQFEKDGLNITVKNLSTRELIISEFTVRNLIAGEGVYEGSYVINQTFTPHTVPLYEPISECEEISFRVSFKWASGYAYEIRLETADTKDTRAMFFAVAP